MRDQLTKISARLEAMSVRERALVVLAVLGLMLALWDAVVLRRLQSRDEEVATLREELEMRTRTLASRAVELERLLATDPHAEARDRQAVLREEIAAVDQTLRESTGGLVAPGEMARLLEDLLAKQSAMHVVSLEALEPEPLVEEENREPSEKAPVYKHGMRIELEGRFADTLAFIEEMERLPWSLFWDRLQYEVVEYPNAKVTLLVHTLSTREGWIRV